MKKSFGFLVGKPQAWKAKLSKLEGKRLYLRNLRNLRNRVALGLDYNEITEGVALWGR